MTENCETVSPRHNFEDTLHYCTGVDHIIFLHSFAFHILVGFFPTPDLW